MQSRKKKVYRWIVAVMSVILLIGQSDFSVSAEELSEYVNLDNVTTYAINIEVRKDNRKWTNHGQRFSLAYYDENGKYYHTTDFNVSEGTYEICVREGTLQTGIQYVPTGVVVTVDGADVDAVVDYYTVKYYNGDQIYRTYNVLSGKTISEPTRNPVKPDYIFSGWMADKDGNTAFDFEEGITEKTNIYAGWREISANGFEENYTIPAESETENHIENTVADSKEPDTGEKSYVEIYMIIAMIACFAYLILYFADKKGRSGES